MMIKSLAAREIFRRCSQVKKQLWGRELWSNGYFASTVGKYGAKTTIAKDVKGQGQNYQQLHKDWQLSLFE